MKTSIIYILLSFLSFFLSGCLKEKVEHTCNIAHVIDAYDYPVKPGMPSWSLLDTSHEMDSVLQIPDNVLNNISTEGLIETSLNYPRFGDLYFLDDYQLAFEILTEHFNGFQELLKRDDAAEKLIYRYELMYPGCNDNNWPSVNGPGSSTSFSFAYIEIIIAQYGILSQLDKVKIKTLLKDTLIKYDEKNQYNYSVFSKKHTVLIAGRIMYLADYTPFIEEYNKNINVKNFIDKVILNSNFETLELVNNYAKKFLN